MCAFAVVGVAPSLVWRATVDCGPRWRAVFVCCSLSWSVLRRDGGHTTDERVVERNVGPRPDANGDADAVTAAIM